MSDEEVKDLTKLIIISFRSNLRASVTHFRVGDYHSAVSYAGIALGAASTLYNFPSGTVPYRVLWKAKKVLRFIEKHGS